MHDMIVNTIIVEGDTILSAGWDSKLVFWVCCYILHMTHEFMRYLAAVSRKRI